MGNWNSSAGRVDLCWKTLSKSWSGQFWAEEPQADGGNVVYAAAPRSFLHVSGGLIDGYGSACMVATSNSCVRNNF
jgi:hypothetical protein